MFVMWVCQTFVALTVENPLVPFRCLPAKRPHRKVVVIVAVIAFELSAEVCKGIKRVCSIKALIIFTVTSFHFSIVLGCKWSDQFLPNSIFFKMDLKKGRLIRTAVSSEKLGKFPPFVSLYTFAWERKSFDQVL